ncbi:hypothetical protein [Streptomyces bicolor]|uniref:hypothetical protein n=1 Tax=Streptomyces bicolor TaxID=66874 RepID=UPI00055E4397|nr:hypothetical protein [Streptomyces bicolor]
MNVEVPQEIRDTAARLGSGAPYALSVIAGQLAHDPDMGRPSELPGILTVRVDGDLFEDCPDLAIGYIREPDWIQIRYLNRARSAEPATDAQDREDGPGPDQDQDQDQDQEQGPGQPADPATDAITVREIADAWYRITAWLRRNAPDSHAALRAGAGAAAMAALEAELGTPIPLELRVLWSLTAGDDGVDGGGCLPGNNALMRLDDVAAVHRLQMGFQAHEDTLNARRPEDERITAWKATWIPVVALGPADSVSGLYLDAETGYLGRWSRFNDDPADELDTLVTYLEEAADMLEAPALATRDRPGLVDGALVWLSRVDPAREGRWQPFTEQRR